MIQQTKPLPRHIIDRFVAVYYPEFPDPWHNETGHWRVSTKVWDELVAHAKKYDAFPSVLDIEPLMFGRPISVDDSLPIGAIEYDIPEDV